MMTRLVTILGLFCMVSILGCGCIGETVRITQEEYAALENSARAFALAKEKTLSDLDKEIISKNNPEFSVYYTTMKYGPYSFIWRLSGGRTLIVSGHGSLTSKDSLHEVEIKTIPGVNGVSGADH